MTSICIENIKELNEFKNLLSNEYIDENYSIVQTFKLVMNTINKINPLIDRGMNLCDKLLEDIMNLDTESIQNFKNDNLDNILCIIKDLKEIKDFKHYGFIRIIKFIKFKKSTRKINNYIKRLEEFIKIVNTLSEVEDIDENSKDYINFISEQMNIAKGNKFNNIGDDFEQLIDKKIAV